jgi:DNA-binding transcriptional regulator GbsR (MarR family)
MLLTPAMQSFILHWGEMGAKWGVNRSVAQIHALLHLSPEPMAADEICETLSLARSNVSNAIKELQGLKIVSVSRKLGDRRDHFTSIRDMFDLVEVVVAKRREAEFVPTLEALKIVLEDAATDETPANIQQRMKTTLDTMTMFDDWYSDVARLPRAVKLGIVKLGAKVAKLIPRS